MHDRVMYELFTTLRNRTDGVFGPSPYDDGIYVRLYSHQLSVYNGLYWRLNEELKEED